MFPAQLTDISLEQWIAYTNKLSTFDEQLNAIQALQDGKRKEILLTKNHVDKAFESAIHFELPGELFVDEILKSYNAFCSLFNDSLSEIHMPDISEIKFGQFIDSKLIIQNGLNRSKWELMRYIISIFYYEYRPENTDENSSEFLRAGMMSMNDVLSISAWFDNLNNHIIENYSIFQDSGEDEGAHMKKHMERWGWINFLKSIAKTKVFDIPGSGMNSIDCVKAATLQDVLVYASEEKEYNIALLRDMNKD